jgi:adenylosuccinate lyase
MKAWNNNGGDFRKNLLADEQVTKLISQKEIEECLDPEHYLRNVGAVFERLGI